MQLGLVLLASLIAVVPFSAAFPKMSMADIEEFKRSEDSYKNQKGRIIKFPPPPTDTGLKRIPDEAHPYKAPGHGDMRGPCPALNTLANHGYIPHNGIATPEEIILAVTEAFNMHFEFARFAVSFATMARGNANIGKLSIGASSDKVPALPGMIDGPVAGGLAKHGRFEGDVSSTRQDAFIGDHVNFQNDLFDELLLYVGKYGETGPDGKMSIVTKKAFQEFKYDRYTQDQQLDRKIEYHIGRQFTTYGEVSFILNLFADGTDGKLFVQGMGSILRNQTFAKNWFRRSSPATFEILTHTAGEIMAAHPVPPGANDANGNYVADKPAFTNFLCDAYADLAGNQLAKSLLTTTGILKTNVDYLMSHMYEPFRKHAKCPKPVLPNGPSGV